MNSCFYKFEREFPFIPGLLRVLKWSYYILSCFLLHIFIYCINGLCYGFSNISNLSILRTLIIVSFVFWHCDGPCFHCCTVLIISTWFLLWAMLYFKSVLLNFLGSIITADGDCSHEIKRRLLLARKAMTNIDSILKSRDITLLTKVCLVKAMVFPLVIYGCESWTIKNAELWRTDAFELWC